MYDLRSRWTHDELACEQAMESHYYCKTCRTVVEDKYLNWCGECLIFIGRSDDCICDDLPEPLTKAEYEASLLY